MSRRTGERQYLHARLSCRGLSSIALLPGPVAARRAGARNRPCCHVRAAAALFSRPERGSAGGGLLFRVPETEASSGLRGRNMRTARARETGRESDALAG